MTGLGVDAKRRVARAMVFAARLALGIVLGLALWIAVPSLALGWEAVVVASGSMQPGLETGDVVVASPHSGESLGPGTVIVFEDPASGGRLTTHRIVEVSDAGTYRTRGDANAATDSTPIPPEMIRGVGRIVVPWVGMPLLWVAGGGVGKSAGLFGAFVVVVVIAMWRPTTELAPRRVRSDPWEPLRTAVARSHRPGPWPRVIAAGAAALLIGSLMVAAAPHEGNAMPTSTTTTAPAESVQAAASR